MGNLQLDWQLKFLLKSVETSEEMEVIILHLQQLESMEAIFRSYGQERKQSLTAP